MVGEHSIITEAVLVRDCGGYGRENVGISSKKLGATPSHRKPKVSWATQIVPGLVGPKVRQKCVIDGQLVNIPALLLVFDGVTQFRRLSVFWL